MGLIALLALADGLDGGGFGGRSAVVQHHLAAKKNRGVGSGVGDGDARTSRGASSPASLCRSSQGRNQEQEGNCEQGSHGNDLWKNVANDSTLVSSAQLVKDLSPGNVAMAELRPEIAWSDPDIGQTDLTRLRSVLYKKERSMPASSTWNDSRTCVCVQYCNSFHAGRLTSHQISPLQYSSWPLVTPHHHAPYWLVPPPQRTTSDPSRGQTEHQFLGSRYGQAQPERGTRRI